MKISACPGHDAPAQRLCAHDRRGGVSHVGIVLGLEVSRLARNNADWYRLLDLCAHDRHADRRRRRHLPPVAVQ